MQDKNRNRFDIPIQRLNAPKEFGRDLYHKLLKASWPAILTYYVLGFLTINFFFAFLYLLIPNALSGEEINFKNAFFFSVQTFATVGYGHITPANDIANYLSILNVMAGMIYVAVTTGMIFAKFSRPTSKILFTENMLMTNFEKKKVLMFRVANARNNQIINANIEVMYTYDHVTPEGVRMRRFEPLQLQRNYTPLFALSWTILHDITESSPFYHKSIHDLKKGQIEIFVIIHGHDSVFGQTIHQMYNYKPDDILIDYYFEDFLTQNEHGTRILDYSKFNKTYKKLENSH